MGKLISLVIALVYLILASIYLGIEDAQKILLFLTLPLAFIWFGDKMGNMSDFSGRIYITKSSHDFLVKFGGWILLFIPLIIGIIKLLSK